MKKRNIRKIGIDKGVKDIELFVEFLAKRFPNESDDIISYFSEWADRFNAGCPEKHMDNKSLSVYNEAKIR